MDTNGNDIVDSGTVIWDASNGYIPESVVNIDLSTNAGNDLSWDSTNSEFDVDSSTIQSGTTASDVGLGNVENENALAQDGSESMSGHIDLNVHSVENTDKIFQDSSQITPYNTNVINMRHNSGDDIRLSGTKSSSSDVRVRANNEIILRSDIGGSIYTCTLASDTGNFNCDGNKNWVHDLGNGSEAVYTSQESPQVRAVFEGKAHVVDSKKIELPSHFSKTVSDSKPMLRAQVTPRGTLTNSAVMEITDDYIKIAVGKETDVNFRVTGIREGYEDKQVVREKEE